MTRRCGSRRDLLRGGAVLLGCAALLLGACAPFVPTLTAPTAVPTDSSSAADASAEPITVAELNEMAASMTTALDQGDVDTWVGWFSGDIDALIDTQSHWFETVQNVPMDVREIHITKRAETDVSDEVEVDVTFLHQISGADVTTVAQDYRYHVERAESGVVQIVSVDGGGLADDLSYPQLWDLGPTTVHVAESVIVIAEHDAAPEVAGLLADLDAAARHVIADLGAEGMDRFLVTLTATDVTRDLFGQVVGAGPAWTVPLREVDLARAGEGDDVARVNRGITMSPRVVITTEQAIVEKHVFGSADSGLPVMRLHGVHAALLGRTSSTPAPAWMRFGFAGWFQVTDDEWTHDYIDDWYRELADGQPPVDLPPTVDREFLLDDDDRNMAEAVLVFRFVESEWGRQTTLDLGVELATSSGLLADGWDLAVQDHLGLAWDEFTDEYVAYATAQLE